MAVKASDNIIGYIAGIIAGVTYGMNPLFGKPLLQAGVPVSTMLFFRYAMATIFMAVWTLARGGSLRISRKQMLYLLIMGICFSSSSIGLFISYKYIPSGLATTIVYLYPVTVALFMIVMKVYPTLRTWASIILTFIGVVILSWPSGAFTLQWQGLVIAGTAPLCYGTYLAMVNCCKTVKDVSSGALSFYSLLVGTVMFFVWHLIDHVPVSGIGALNVFSGLHGWHIWLNIIGLAVFPTMIAVLTLSISARKIGAPKASVLGVFEPITAILIGVLAFGEQMSVNVIVGVVISLFAVTFMAVPPRKKARA